MKTIACLGSGFGAPGDAIYDAMVDVGRLLAWGGCDVATGGFGGAGMEAPARGAKEAGGTAIGYTMLGKKPNVFITAEVDCSRIPHLTIPVEMQYGIRLGRLLAADGFIIAANGGPGTMVELMAIINLNCKIWEEKPKRFAILDFSATNKEDSWNWQMMETLKLWGVFPEKIAHCFASVHTPFQAVDWVCQ